MPANEANIFKRSDGQWVGYYKKAGRERNAIYGCIYGNSYEEVEEKIEHQIGENSEDEKEESLPEPPTLEALSLRWLNDLQVIRKKSTIVKYQAQLDSHIIPCLGAFRIDELSNKDIIGFGSHLLTVKKLSPKTASDILSRVKSIRKYAVIHGYKVNFHPECLTIPQSSKLIRVLSFAEQETLLAYLDDHVGLTSLGILVCLFTGIRIGELCALKWTDISLPEKELRVRRTMQRLKDLSADGEAKTYIHIDEPKSKCSLRTVPIPDRIMEPLTRAHEADGYLLTASSRHFVEPRTMENRFKAILKECHIEDANFHSLRHTYATRCIEAGVDVKALSEILGHSNVRITLNRYVHPTMQFKHDNVNKLSALFSSKGNAN